MIQGMRIFGSIKDIAERMPSDETITRLLESLPELSRLIDKMPSDETLQGVLRLAPALANMPSEDTLKRLLREMENIRGYMDRLPNKKDMDKFAEQLARVDEFLKALKGG